MLSKDAAFLKTAVDNADNSSQKNDMTDFLSYHRQSQVTQPEELKVTNAISPCL